MAEGHGHTDIQPGSERSFGIVFAVVFAIVALYPLTGDGGVRLWALGFAAAFLGLGFLVPRVLKPLNVLWFRFGILLGKVVTPIVMGILFIVTVTPIGLIRRAMGADPLRAKPEPEAESYWIEIKREGDDAPSMKRQF